jgi:hypothetical protein
MVYPHDSSGPAGGTSDRDADHAEPWIEPRYEEDEDDEEERSGRFGRPGYGEGGIVIRAETDE